MSPHALFDASNALASLVWALMIFTPRWKYTRQIVRHLVVPCLLALAYLLIILRSFSPDSLEFNTLEDIRRLFEDDHVLLAGWIHYLAFDLLVGSWILFKSQLAGIPHLLVVPVLLLTFIMGPVGLLAFVLVYLVRKREWPTLL